MVFMPAQKASAQPAPVSKERLSQALQQAAKADDYAWLRANQPETKNNDFFSPLIHDVDILFDSIGSGFTNFRHWLDRLLNKRKPTLASDSKEPLANTDTRWLLYGLAGVVVIGAIVFLWRTRPGMSEPTEVSSSAVPTVDLNKESVLASDLPEEEWLRLAQDLLAKNEPRLAVRAMYLSNLSYLGSQNFIRIAKSKSNSIYERELRLRPRGNGLAVPFAQSNRRFERTWYGFHDATPEVVAAFQEDVEALRQNAKV
jgi:hypothetical protein